MHVRRPLMAVTGLALTALLAGCAGDDLASENDEPTSGSGGGGGEGTSVVIGSQSFDEAALVTAMYQQVLEAEGYEVETRLVDTRPIYLNEMPDSVQIAPEYVAGIVDQLNTDANGPDAKPLSTSDAQETIDAGASLLEEKGITLLEPSEAFSANGYFTSQEFSDSEGVTKLSDLEGQKVTLAAAPDCKGRTDCEKGLVDTYGIDITLEPLGYASTETFQAVLDGEAQLGQTSTLDGTLEDQGLLLLEDDKGIQPAQNLIPAVSTEFLADHPDIEGPLNDLMAALDNETLGGLLVSVQIERRRRAGVPVRRGRRSSLRVARRRCPRLRRRDASRSSTSWSRSASAAGSTVVSSSTEGGTDSRQAPVATSCTRGAGPSSVATHSISAVTSARRSCSTSQPASRWTGGRPLCTSERRPQSSSTPERSSRHHSGVHPGTSRK